MPTIIRSSLAALAILAVSLFALPALAAGAELGPPVGATIPHDLSVEDGPDIAALSAQNGIALFFIRSVDWCPFCKGQVIDVSARYDDFAALGLEPVYLSYDARETQARFAQQRAIRGTFVSDPASTVIRAFGLLNETHEPGSRVYGIPHPAVFIVTPEGEIVAKLYEEDYLDDPDSYRDRPAVEIILEQAEAALTE